MTSILLLLVATLVSVASGVPTCEDSWITYKDELCIKAFTSLETYDNAKTFCALQGDEVYRGSLVIIKNAEMQSLLGNYTQDFVDYIWLGGRYDTSSSQFKWEDGSTLINYSNWMDGYPKDDVGQDSCIEMRPLEQVQNQNYSVRIRGKWAHESCRKRNLVVCQRALSWSLRDSVVEIIKLRQQHEQHEQEQAGLKIELQETRSELEEVQQKLTTVNSKVIPVGSIYVEYYNQPSPRTLWPTLTWQDVSSTYAGLFFRAIGSGSAGWGSTQPACAPRIISTLHQQSSSGAYPDQIGLPASGWSPVGNAGNHLFGSGGRGYEGLRFYTEDCEVRPKNQAVRIWKRTA